MKASEYKNFKMPTPTRGQYDFAIVDAEEVEGKREDINGETSKGLKLTLSINAPPDALMSDGSSAVGYTFSQSWWEPRKSLVDSKPQVAARMKRDIARIIEAAFGDTAPDDINPPDWIGRNIIGQGYSHYDDYQGEEIFEISQVLTPSDLAK